MRKNINMKSKTNFHILRRNDKLHLQEDFLFFDTETKRIINKNKSIEEKFKLGWMIYWNKSTNEKRYIYLKKKNIFYEFILKFMKEKNHLTIFAHNTDFDIKVIGGINRLIENGFIVDSFYINGLRFIITLKKKNKIIEILDTLNYIPMSLKSIGESIGLNKMEIDFNTCNDKYLSDYCKNDTEIIFLFISKLIKFLDEYNLSKLKPTVASLAMNIFRHKFYDKKKKPIYIHSWNKAIELERMSYRGGISDCLKVGEHFKDELFKLDINSMYPYIMSNFKTPTKLLHYRDITTCKSKKLKDLYVKYREDKLIIARVKIYLPKEYAYILVKADINKQSKSMFLHGKFIITLATPELNFVEKYGRILEFYNISIYDGKINFKDFVDFFYKARFKFDNEGNKANKLFCKYILNSLYGKFGQTQTTYNITEKNDNEFSSKYIIDSPNNDKFLEMCLGNRVFEVNENGKNSYDSFVAIPSFITAYARMYLVEMILKAQRKNVYYVDTDCLIVNKEGYNNLEYLINKTELGKLKLEETSNDTTIYRPKYYFFNHKEKCKGVKKNHKKLFEDKDKLIVEQEQFTRFKTSLKNNEIDKQIVSKMIKEMSKEYDKGIILPNGDIEPYEYNN